MPFRSVLRPSRGRMGAALKVGVPGSGEFSNDAKAQSASIQTRASIEPHRVIKLVLSDLLSAAPATADLTRRRRCSSTRPIAAASIPRPTFGAPSMPFRRPTHGKIAGTPNCNFPLFKPAQLPCALGRQWRSFPPAMGQFACAGNRELKKFDRRLI
jgi:hypothetical protein